MKLLLTILITFLMFTADAQLRQCQINIRNEIKLNCKIMGLNPTQTDLVLSIGFRESSFMPFAYNKKDSSAGLFGITRIFVRDINRIVGYKKYIYTDRYSIQKSIEMLIIYINHYVPGWNHEKICNRWNKGSNYWNLIQKEINIAHE